MTDYAIKSQINDLRRIDRNAAQEQISQVREFLRRAGLRLSETGSYLVEADAIDLVQIAHELTREATHLRRLAVELNSATATAAESIAEQARGRGIEL